MLIKSIFELIGNTPLLEIAPTVHGLQNINLFAKLEHLNPFGSIKDRAAWNILSQELASLKVNGNSVIESSSGNMAKAMQVICSMHDIPFRLLTDRAPVKDIKNILQVLGANIEIFENSTDSSDKQESSTTKIEKELSSQPGMYFHPNQYNNERNSQTHFENTGPEIIFDLKEPVDFFIAPMGTSGSSRGTGEYLRAQNQDLKIIGVLSKEGQAIPGTRNREELKSVGLFKSNIYNHIIEATSEDAIVGMLALARKSGILAGPSSGATYMAALNYLSTIDSQLTTKTNAVFIVCDRMESYMSYLAAHKPELNLDN